MATTSNSAPTFEESALFAEWRALHEQYGTNARAMPRLYAAISDLKDRFRRQAFRAALISEWVQVDAPGGLPFFLGKGRDETQRRQFFEEWLARDPRLAVDALLAGGAGWEQMARECLKKIAQVTPERVPEIAARLPKSDNYWEREVHQAFVILAERDLVSAQKAAEALTGANRDFVRADAVRDRGRDAFQPQRRDRPPRLRDTRRNACRQMRRTRNIV